MFRKLRPGPNLSIKSFEDLWRTERNICRRAAFLAIVARRGVEPTCMAIMESTAAFAVAQRRVRSVFFFHLSFLRLLQNGVQIGGSALLVQNLLKRMHKGAVILAVCPVRDFFRVVESCDGRLLTQNFVLSSENQGRCFGGLWRNLRDVRETFRLGR